MAVQVQRRNGDLRVAGLPRWIVGLFPEESDRRLAAQMGAKSAQFKLKNRAPIGSPIRPSVRVLMQGEFGRWD